MAVVVDSSVLIAYERHGLSGTELAALLTDSLSEPVAITSLIASELLFGVHRAAADERARGREIFVESLLQTVPVLPFDLEAARMHAMVGAALAEAGTPIGAHDLIIAATALTHGYAVLTHNLRDFQRVPGLVVRQPAW